MVILYQHDLTGMAVNDLMGGFAAENGHELDPFTREIVAAILADTGALDREIDRYSSDWPAHRMASLERNILRIAIYEILELDEIPFEASIDEAVTLAKRFCSREAAALINGILGTLAQERTGE